MKIQRIENVDKTYFSWKYEAQTKIKHQVLGSYSKVWISKVGLYNNTIFVDCHAGCGSYLDDFNKEQFGSSMIVKDAAKDLEKIRHKETKIICCEKNKVTYKNLLSVLKYNNYDNFFTYNDNFENVLNEESFYKITKNNSILFFVDPSGFDFDINSLKGMMSNKGSEILINFMFDFIKRFISNPKLEKVFNSFFGCDKWKVATKFSGDDRENFLVNLYKDKLKDITKSKFVFFYRIYYPNRNQTYYYLVHCTNHIEGITKMKDIFSLINNGHLDYRGKYNSQLTFFDLSWYKANDLYDKYFKKNRNKSTKFVKLWEYLADKVNYTDKDLNQALNELINDNKIRVVRISSHRGRFKGDDCIYVL